MAGNSDNILEINSIEVMYDSVISALHDVSLNVPKGKIVALLGGNGAGKSTTLKSISTMLAAERGKVTKGSIIYDGTEVKNQNPYEMVTLGMVQVLEGEDAIATNRRLMGATNPKEADPGTIRADFAESIDANAVHGSDSPESAAREIAFFFTDAEIISRS